MTRSATAHALIDVSIAHEALFAACEAAFVVFGRLTPVVQRPLVREIAQVRAALLLARRVADP